MSLYNTLFGVNPAAEMLLAMLYLKASEVPRFRDCFLKGNTIVVYTRTGGGNRDAYKERNAMLCAIPGFLGTHAYFCYAIPPQYGATLIDALRTQGAERDPAVEWPRLLNKLRDPAMKDDPEVVATLAKMAPIIQKIQSAIDDGAPPIIEI